MITHLGMVKDGLQIEDGPPSKDDLPIKDDAQIEDGPPSNESSDSYEDKQLEPPEKKMKVNNEIPGTSTK